MADVFADAFTDDFGATTPGVTATATPAAALAGVLPGVVTGRVALLPPPGRATATAAGPGTALPVPSRPGHRTPRLAVWTARRAAVAGPSRHATDRATGRRSALAATTIRRGGVSYG